MMKYSVSIQVHPMGEERYATNGTLVAAQGRVAYMEVGEERELGAVGFTTPWNRTTYTQNS